MNRALLTSVLIVAVLAPLVVAESPQTRLPVTATAFAVVSASELDVMVTRSSISDIVAAGTVVRVVYHGIRTPDRFDPLYMEALDLQCILTTSREIFFDVAAAPWDSEQRLHAYVYLDPHGHGMMNAFLLAAGLAAIDPEFSPEEAYGELLIGIAAAAEGSGLGIWAEPAE
ncbi:hypothetical protein KJ567_02185 [Candidatus Bipolaricaulota bacterium]|nr:hypothetical protein [Candidatus Bipolaricaulota bacterium]